jgi:hypothetical protein
LKFVDFKKFSMDEMQADPEVMEGLNEHALPLIQPAINDPTGNTHSAVLKFHFEVQVALIVTFVWFHWSCCYAGISVFKFPT